MKNKTAYYIIGAIAAYYAYQWWKKNKQAPSAPLIDQSGTVTTVTPTVMSVSTKKPLSIIESLNSLVTPSAQIVVEQPNTYQTFYGNISGTETKKVPMTC